MIYCHPLAVSDVFPIISINRNETKPIKAINPCKNDMTETKADEQCWGYKNHIIGHTILDPKCANFKPKYKVLHIKSIAIAWNIMELLIIVMMSWWATLQSPTSLIFPKQTAILIKLSKIWYA